VKESDISEERSLKWVVRVITFKRKPESHINKLERNNIEKYGCECLKMKLKI
jgi:hypothetical protein